ncbi:MAG: metallophosphoesterase [Anaerolineae bacterium]|nr:metallophosphoesterase [Anaerolineae bacterium]
MKLTTNTTALYRYMILLVLGLLILSCSGQAVTVEPPVVEEMSEHGPAATPTKPAPVTPSPTPSFTPSPTPIVPGAEIPLSNIAYRLPLTIRHVTPGAVTLFFELAAPASGSVFLRPVDINAPTLVEDLDPAQTRHRLTIDGLEPGTRYEVTVALGSTLDDYQQPQFLSRAWGPVSFRTASESGQLRFGVLSDASFGDSATTALIENMAGADLDFVLHAGDVVDETEQDVDPFDSYARKYYTPFEPLLKQMPIYTAIGNHDQDPDIRWQDVPFYYHAFPPFPDPHIPGQEAMERSQYYAFVYQDIRFIVLDSQVMFGAAGRKEQEAWLADQLADTGYKTTIMLFHVAPFSSSSVHIGEDLPVRYAWTPLFEAAGVPLVFSGHFHHYERLSSNGITYITSGGGSSILYAPGDPLPESIIMARRTHFVLVEIDGDRLALTATALEGDIIDQAEIALGN